MDQYKLEITQLLDEAAQASDSRTNGLMDRDEFPILIRRLADVVQCLLVKQEHLERQRRELAQQFVRQSLDILDIAAPSDTPGKIHAAADVDGLIYDDMGPLNLVIPLAENVQSPPRPNL
jgi:hypothetical protein